MFRRGRRGLLSLCLLAILSLTAPISGVLNAADAADGPLPAPAPPSGIPAATAADDAAMRGPETLYLFIIDDSSSMHENDPNNLRLQAAQLVLALAHDTDQVAVVRFRQSARLVLPPTVVGPVANRFKDPTPLREVKNEESPDGTNFLGAFTSAQEILDPWKGKGRVMAIFLTDGEDVGASNDQLSFQVHSLAKKAFARGAYDFQMRIFGIGKGTSPAQLNLIREESKGTLVQVANAADLIDRVLTQIIEGHNIGRLDLPLPKTFELGPDVIRIGIIGVGGDQAGLVGYLEGVSVRQFGKTVDLLTEPGCLRYPPLDEFRQPGRYQIAVAEHPPAGTYTITTVPGFELVDIVVERRLSFLVNPLKPPGRVAQFEPFELSVFMVGTGNDLRALARRTRITADIYGPFSPHLEATGRQFNSNTRVGSPLELTFDDDLASTRLEFSARVGGLGLTDDQLRDGSFTVLFRAVTKENDKLTWTRLLPSRDIAVERLPGRLHLELTDPAARFEAIDQLTKNVALRLLSTYLEPLPVCVEFQVARPDQPQPAGLHLPPLRAVVLEPGHEQPVTSLPVGVGDEGNLDLIARVFVPTPEQFLAADPELLTLDAKKALTMDQRKKRLAELLPTAAALAKADAPKGLQRVRHAVGATDSQGFSLTLRRPRIVIEPSRVTLDLDRHPIESLWFKDAMGDLKPRGIFARLPMAPNTRERVHPVMQPEKTQLRTVDGRTLNVTFDLPEGVKIGEQPTLHVNVLPQDGGKDSDGNIQGIGPGLYTGEADLTVETLDHKPLPEAQRVRLLIKVELVDEMALYRTWLPALLIGMLVLLLLSVIVLTRPRFISHQLRLWEEGKPATRVYPLISFARGWWKHRAGLPPEMAGTFTIKMNGLRRLGKTYATLALSAKNVAVFVNKTEQTAQATRLRHGDLITVVSAGGQFRYLYFEYIPREEELPRYDGVVSALPGLFLDEGDFLLIDDAPPAAAAAGAELKATVLV